MSVGVFWDLTSCPIPADRSVHDLVGLVRREAARLGTARSITAYVNYEPILSLQDVYARSILQKLGVVIVDCMGDMSAMQMMMAVDIMSFALDNPTGAIIVLAACQDNLVYCIHSLRARKYSIAFCRPPHDCHQALCSVSDKVLDWLVKVPDTEFPMKEKIIEPLEPLAEFAAEEVPPPERATEEVCAGHALPAPSVPSAMVGWTAFGPPAPFRAPSRRPSPVLSAAGSPPHSTPPLEDIRVLSTASSPREDHSSNDVPRKPTAFPTPSGSRRASPPPPSTDSSTPSGSPSASGPPSRAVSLTHTVHDEEESHVQSPAAALASAVHAEEECSSASDDEECSSASVVDECGSACDEEQCSSASVEDDCSSASDASPQQPTSVRSPSPPRQTNSTSTPDAMVHYVPLLNVLSTWRRGGQTKVLFSQLGAELLRSNPSIYRQAGAVNLSAYLAHAKEKGIVHVGRPGPGREFVKLRSQYYGWL